MKFTGTLALLSTATLAFTSPVSAEQAAALGLAESFNAGKIAEMQAKQSERTNEELKLEKEILAARKKRVMELIKTAIKYQDKLIKERDSEYRQLVNAFHIEESKSEYFSVD